MKNIPRYPRRSVVGPSLPPLSRQGLSPFAFDPPGSIEPASVQVRQAAKVALEHKRSEALALLHATIDQAIEVQDVLTNPSGTVTLTEITVPDGFVARIDALAVVYSNPHYAQNSTIGWKVLIDDRSPANWKSSFSDSRLLYWSVGSIEQPLDITPLPVRPGGKFAIVVVTPASFDDALSISSRVRGEMLPVAVPGLSEEV
jgi:hypothetical protein